MEAVASPDAAKPFAAPMEAFTNPQGGVSSIFVYDPDGILVQFDNGSGG